jgi:hypothetical protein
MHADFSSAGRLAPARMTLALAAVALLATGVLVRAQQVADTTFRPPIEKPTHATGSGPVVLIDEGHFNFHTSSGRYSAFADLLRRDGYIVRPSTGAFGTEGWRSGKVLVIANALHEENDRNEWKPPFRPAFTPEEVDAVRNWVAGGGRLLLIADHAPFDTAASNLAGTFGVKFRDAATVGADAGQTRAFKKSDGTLREHPLTRDVDQITTFSGGWFDQGLLGQPLMFYGAQGQGPVQGAVIVFGKGKVAVFGEAAMFSAQLSGPNKTPMGMNAPGAEKNAQLALNVMRWLTTD